MNEFVEDIVIDSYINVIYQSMYAKIDKGVKNGEADLVIDIRDRDGLSTSNQIKQYFDSIYSSPRLKLKKYFIQIDIKNCDLYINIKWGHHAIVANNKGE